MILVTVTPVLSIRAEGLLTDLTVTETIDANNIVHLDPVPPSYDQKNSIFAGSFNLSADTGLIYESGGGGKGLNSVMKTVLLS